jgi:D-alanine-D-alanine ligase
MAKTKVVVLFGGRSSEHVVGCATAAAFLEFIDRTRYDVIPVGITREGAFVLEDDNPAKFALNPAKLPEVLDNGTRVIWPEPNGDRRLRVRAADGEIAVLGEIDIVLLSMLGAHGEDGAIQGFLDTIEVPYTGGGIVDSAMCMDKHFMKIALRAAGIPVSDWVTVTHADWQSDPDSIRDSVRELGFPVYVKPAREGSSVGVSRVASEEELAGALEIAFGKDRKVLIEIEVKGRELEVSVLEAKDGVKASLPGEIVLTGREFYDWDGKYMGAPGVEIVCPAVLTDAQIAAVKELGVKAFNAVDGQGFARVDMFMTDEALYVNEINTMPGFTPISMYPKCWVASGLSYPELLTEIIETGRRRVSLAG